MDERVRYIEISLNWALFVALVPAWLELRKGRDLDHQDGGAPRTRRLSANARRALELLASDPATVSIMLDQGFTRRMLIDLVSAGLAMLGRSPLRVGGRTVDVSYIKITAAGRQAIGD